MKTQLKSTRTKLPWTENEIDHTVQHLSIPIATGRAAVGLCAGHLGVIEREIRSRTGPSAYALSPMTASPAQLTVIIKVTLLVLGAVGSVPPCGQVINQHVVPVSGGDVFDNMGGCVVIWGGGGEISKGWGGSGSRGYSQQVRVWEWDGVR